jgi:hypothetical protein
MKLVWATKTDGADGLRCRTGTPSRNYNVQVMFTPWASPRQINRHAQHFTNLLFQELYKRIKVTASGVSTLRFLVQYAGCFDGAEN